MWSHPAREERRRRKEIKNHTSSFTVKVSMVRAWEDMRMKKKKIFLLFSFFFLLSLSLSLSFQKGTQTYHHSFEFDYDNLDMALHVFVTTLMYRQVVGMVHAHDWSSHTWHSSIFHTYRKRFHSPHPPSEQRQQYHKGNGAVQHLKTYWTDDDISKRNRNECQIFFLSKGSNITLFTRGEHLWDFL